MPAYSQVVLSFFFSLWKRGWVISACVGPTKNGAEVTVCCALPVTMVAIYSTFSCIPPHLVCTQWDLWFVFQQDNDSKHSSRLCAAYLTKKVSEGALHHMTWPPQSPELDPVQMVWDELGSKVKEQHLASAQHIWEQLQDQTTPDDHMKLVDRESYKKNQMWLLQKLKDIISNTLFTTNNL